MGNPSTRRRSLWLLAALELGVGLAAVGYRLWKQFNPFVNDSRTAQEATRLRDAARRGPLTPAEFGRVMELSGPSREPIVSLTVIAILQIEAERTPDRVESVKAALSDLTSHSDAGVRSAATSALARLTTAQ